MRKKEIIWIGVLLILFGLYAHFFTHWFERPQIRIDVSLRPSRRAGAPVFPVAFTLDGDYKLTSLKVIPLEEGKSSPQASPVWHLVSDSNSVPTRAFRYGQNIRGMRPALKDVRPDPLTPGVVYKLVLAAGNLTGESKPFQTKAVGD